ncbi:DUF4260 domain-containing protein [Balneolaceae bacterium YR4-1]|uniref:DUF4260 domain-containing protein n=1 Tax=Halalkalibaculum roseum TaxID=2709311 RepID=A0A6M1T3S8_9BACT|nr:DUF4260 domain-containing protein [Halalkalibaculum roseum]NGP76645.1 DUF4260 domain-containing protein [Halalkalibaculum roseum]
MDKLIKLEEAGMFVLGLFLFATLDYSWWVFPVLLLAPDISMAGYLFGNRTGAFVYNIVHHKGIAILIYCIGFLSVIPVLMLAGIILFSHSSMDRILGYGLKYEDSFQHTHLGQIGINVNK